MQRGAECRRRITGSSDRRLGVGDQHPGVHQFVDVVPGVLDGDVVVNQFGGKVLKAGPAHRSPQGRGKCVVLIDRNQVMRPNGAGHPGLDEPHAARGPVQTCVRREQQAIS